MNKEIFKAECRCEICDHLIVKSNRVFNKYQMYKAQYNYILYTKLFKCNICGFFGLPIIFKMNKNKKWVKFNENEDLKL